MHLDSGKVLYSATDLVNFLGCTHSTALDIQQLREPVEFSVDDPYLELLQAKGVAHEHAYLEILRASGLSIIEIDAAASREERVLLTRKAMSDGIEIIYQGALLGFPWHGYSDFLIKREGLRSRLGNYAYEVIDTKLSRSAKPKHVIQLSVYSRLIADEQKVSPHEMHIVLGDGTKVSLHVSDYAHYCDIARGRFESFATLLKRDTVAEPCGHCHFCRWNVRCEDEWDKGDHLSLVANISRSQMTKLRAEGVATLRQLASLGDSQRIPKLQSETLARLRAQAALQAARRAGGSPQAEVLALIPQKGFARLPLPDTGDIFFDMEGDPLFDDGLEYLFGFDHTDDGRVCFTSFWAHDRVQEKKAFQDAVDFMVARLKSHPDAHVYHYASYEETALKRLAMVHGTRETEIDDLLRQRKFVDLYKVVREGIRVSEPAYSLKNLEVFYAEARQEKVTSGGDSIVVYERWRRLRNDELLQEISDYNEFDCKSTRMCRDWLLTLRPSGVEWFDATTVPQSIIDLARDENRREAEAITSALQAALLERADPEDQSWRELLGYLLEFHHREAKPSWWAMFNRMEMNVEELIDDAECMGGLTSDAGHKPYGEKRSTVYSFRVPPQDFKMKVGGAPLRAGSGEPAGEIVKLDEDLGLIALKLGPTRSRFEEPLSLIPTGPLDDKILRAAIFRYANAVAEGKQDRYAALTSVLSRTLPRVDGCIGGEPLVGMGASLLDASVDVICRMHDTHMLVQGPPGSGKTFMSSHAIVELLHRGKRVGVSSNSHKAINNLLKAVEKVATDRGIRFRGVKKSKGEDQCLNGCGLIIDTADNKVAASPDYQLVAGTAWLFARDDFDQAFDYLFVDEAGQVSLANVIAMGVSAKNLVLVGDQMQLSQPTQGSHPGDSGLSALEYLLGDRATVPPAEGIFLATTWRLHPDICRFISMAVYDGRLEPANDNKNQVLVLGPRTDYRVIAASGLRFVDVIHEGCSQECEEEGRRVRATFDSLLLQSWTDRTGTTRRMEIDDILVVTPYNMQVNLLKTMLPAGARVGTVDKIQGQQAVVVLISMATSSGDDLPRQIDFLYSRNRLNVAISRARSLAVVFASPRLLEVTCKTIEEMKLVNTLCWVKAFADDQVRTAEN
jgi:predicted RecB family nuclease